MYILSVTSGKVYLCRSLCRLITLPSDTYFRNGVNITVFIEQMRKIFILTDLMFSGQHLYFEKFLRDAKLENTEITCEPEYWNLHNHRWEEFDALYCIIDLREQFIDNQEFGNKCILDCG